MSEERAASIFRVKESRVRIRLGYVARKVVVYIHGRIEDTKPGLGQWEM
jgi:hypothetical protein